MRTGGETYLRVAKFFCNKKITLESKHDFVVTELELGAGFVAPWIGALNQGLVLLRLVLLGLVP